MQRKAYRVKGATLLGWLMVVALTAGLVSGAAAQVVHFKELMPILDIKLSGWEIQDKPSGSTTKSPVQMSEAHVKFRAGDNRSLEIIIVDGVGSTLPYLNMSQMVEMESSEEYVRPADIQGFKGMETYRIKDKDGEIILNVANRFLVTIKGEGLDNTDALKAAGQQLDLKKLAALAK